MRIGYTVTTDSPYPIKTEGSVESSGWQVAARKAAEAHRDDLRSRKKLRRQGDHMHIHLWLESR